MPITRKALLFAAALSTLATLPAQAQDALAKIRSAGSVSVGFPN